MCEYACVIVCTCILLANVYLKALLYTDSAYVYVYMVRMIPAAKGNDTHIKDTFPNCEAFSSSLTLISAASKYLKIQHT